MPEAEKERARPLVPLKAIYNEDISEYPLVLRVPMDNGNVVDYQIAIEMPPPAFKRVMKLLDKIPYGLSDKGYKAKHIKK